MGGVGARVYFSDEKWFSGRSRKRKITGFPFFSDFSIGKRFEIQISVFDIFRPDFGVFRPDFGVFRPENIVGDRKL